MLQPSPLAEALIAECRERLRAVADPQRAQEAARFFTDNPPILGAPSGYAIDVGAEMARRLKAEGGPSDALAVAEALYRSGILEEGAAASEMLGRRWRTLGPEDWPAFHRWIGWFTSWATTDSFCLKVTAQLVLRDGPPLERLRAWAADPCLWRRRASLVSMVRAGRAGRHLDVIWEMADRALADPEDMMQKAVGWTLKETCKGDVEAVIAYLRSRSDRMSRLAARYAAEGLTPEQRDRVRGR